MAHVGQLVDARRRRRPAATWCGRAPGDEPAALDALPDDVAAALAEPGAVVLVGERAAEVPGLLAAVSELAGADRGPRRLGAAPRRGARRRWTPARCRSLLPGARPVDDADARDGRRGELWGVPHPARDARVATSPRCCGPPRTGELAGLVVGGVEPADLPDPALARAALAEADVVISPGAGRLRGQRVRRRGAPGGPRGQPQRDLPQLGGSRPPLRDDDRPRPGRLLGRVGGTAAVTLPDCRVLDSLAVEMDVDLFTQTPEVAGGGARRAGHRGGHAVRRRRPARSRCAARSRRRDVTRPRHRRQARPARDLAPAARRRRAARRGARPARHRPARPVAGGRGDGAAARAGRRRRPDWRRRSAPDGRAWRCTSSSSSPTSPRTSSGRPRTCRGRGGVITLAGLGLHHGGPRPAVPDRAATPSRPPIGSSAP